MLSIDNLFSRSASVVELVSVFLVTTLEYKSTQPGGVYQFLCYVD